MSDWLNLPEWLIPPAWLIAFFLALTLGTLVEYWGHRFMHNWLLKKKHAEHHRDGWGQGWFWEFLDYIIPTSPILVIAYFFGIYGLESMDGVWGFIAGGVFYACFAAYSHQLQHEKPELCFWMKRPCHYIHHKEKMWHTNFGISIDLWDRVFGTYRVVDWKPEPGKWSLKGYFTIKWI
jgi:sterol desaturase/sphingolipid hydroxylase (fatty acid hydroxylase superfamily)